jgi:hypothetical protein
VDSPISATASGRRCVLTCKPVILRESIAPAYGSIVPIEGLLYPGAGSQRGRSCALRETSVTTVVDAPLIAFFVRRPSGHLETSLSC